MKSKYHLSKNQIWVQLTDGSIFKLNIFLNDTKIRLNTDPKSHTLWKEYTNIKVNQNYKTIFFKKFNFLKK